MLNSKTLDELAARINKAIENSPAKDIEKNVKALLQSGLARLDVVPRTEFDTQAQVLLKTREKLEQLEARVVALEARFASPPAARQDIKGHRRTARWRSARAYTPRPLGEAPVGDVGFI